MRDEKLSAPCFVELVELGALARALLRPSKPRCHLDLDVAAKMWYEGTFHARGHRVSTEATQDGGGLVRRRCHEQPVLSAEE